MIIALLIILVCMVGALNYQFFNAFIQPKMMQEKLDLQNVIDKYKEIELEKAQKDFKKRNSLD
jgi:predicted Fe-Mo cluster-binding NifX family protein